VQVLKDIGCFVFSVIGASGVRIGNRDTRWKASSERFLMIVTKSAYVHIYFGQFVV